MKLNTQQRDVLRSGVGRESTFRIAANAQAFDILSSKLYTDARLAIVRELSTNAYDAQVEAGTQDKPFKVHLPNDFATFFSIRDYGTGLSPEAIESIYTTYFASTRNDSNDYTGALGLGSKSPFSYTDQFTVTSYHNGTAYTYSAFKAEGGEPSIALLSEVPTDEENGLEIKINIRPGDAWEFERAARKVYRFFPVRPEISGRKIDFPNTEPAYYSDEYAIFANDPGTIGVPGRINVVMGNVCYNVSNQHVNASLGANATLVMFMPIGTCQVAASREELHYDPVTITNLQAKIDEAIDSIKKIIDQELQACGTLIERMIKINQFRYLLEMNYAKIMIQSKKDNVYDMRRLDVRNDKLFMGQDRFNDTLDPNHEFVFVENDVGELTQKEKNRMRHWIMQEKQRIRATANYILPYFYLVDIQDRPGFLEVFGATTIELSKLPDPPRNVITGISNSNRSFIHECTGQHNLTAAWKSIKVQEADNTKIIAVPRKGNYVVWQGSVMQPHVAQAIALEMGYQSLYGISERHFIRIADELGLSSLEVEAEKYVKNAVKKMTVAEHARMQYGWMEHNGPKKLMNALRGLSDVCNDLVNMSEAKTFSYMFGQLMAYFGIKKPEVADPLDTFRRRYPLIAKVELQYTSIADIVEYISLREAKLAANHSPSSNTAAKPQGN